MFQLKLISVSSVCILRLMSDSATLIDIRSLSKSFDGRTPVLNDLNIKIQSGESVALVGANGAGKSTLIKMILGFVRPSSGEITVFGSLPGTRETRDRTGYLPEMAGFWPELSAEELLQFLSRLRGVPPKSSQSRIEKLLDVLGLKFRGSRRTGGYSKGMLQRTGIAASLIGNPDFWILDEPMSGLDPRAQQKFRDLILKLKESGKTILVSSHSLDDLKLLCDRVIVLEKTKVIMDGKTDEVLPKLQKLYKSSEPWDEDPMGDMEEGWRL